MAVVMGGHRVFPHCPGVCLARENAVAPRYRGLGLYSACRLCGAGRQRFDKPWRFRRRLVAGLDSWIAAAGVVAVAIKTKSMLWCCVSGIVFYIVLSFI